jgi:hypothetical protein
MTLVVKKLTAKRVVQALKRKNNKFNKSRKYRKNHHLMTLVVKKLIAKILVFPSIPKLKLRFLMPTNRRRYSTKSSMDLNRSRKM